MEKRLYKNKNFMLLFWGRMVSNIGSSIHSTAIIWFIMELAGEVQSGKIMAIMGICGLVPAIIMGVFGGVFVDRWNRRKIIYISDFIQGFIFLVMAYLAYTDRMGYAVIFIVTGLSAVIASFFNPAVEASMPNIVSEEELMKANSAFGIVRQVTSVGGAAISGFLYFYFGLKGVLLINAVSFILSGVSEMFLKIEYKPTENKKLDMIKELKEGFNYIKNMKIIMIIVGLAVFVNFMISPLFQIVFPKMVKFDLLLTSREYGIMEGIFPIGAVLGMVVIGAIVKNLKGKNIIAISCVFFGVFISGIGLNTYLYKMGIINYFTTLIIMGLLFILLGIAMVALNLPMQTYFQKTIADEYRGRFFGIMGAMCQASVPIGLILFGFISDKISQDILFMGSGILVFIVGFMMFKYKELNEIA